MSVVDLSKVNKYLDWVKAMLLLDGKSSNAARREVRRGEVYKCNLGIGVGSEENKERPCVIIQNNSANKRSPNTIVAPITHTARSNPVVVPISDKFDNSGNLILDGYVLLGNVVCVSKARLGDYKAKLTTDEMKQVDIALSKAIGLCNYYDKFKNILNDKEDHILKLKNKIVELENELKNQVKDKAI